MLEMQRKILSETFLFSENKCKGLCVSVLDQSGYQMFFTRKGTPTPCSLTLSFKKAFTAFSFQKNNDDIYQLSKTMKNQPLISDEYCFIPGGVVVKSNDDMIFYVGVSSDTPSFDKEMALYLSDILES